LVSLVSEGPVAGTVCQPGGVHLAEKVAGGRGTWWMGRYICQQTREGSDKKRKERGERREERGGEAREAGRLKDRGRETERGSGRGRDGKGGKGRERDKGRPARTS